MEETIVALDVGTTKICTLVAEVTPERELRIVGMGVAPSRGLRKGVVVDIEEATRAIAASVEKAEHLSGYHIDSAYVGIAGAHISSLNSRGVAAVSRGERGIIQDDIDRALDAARAVAIPQNRELIHAIPRGYVVDGQEGVRNPLGLRAFRLEVEAHIVTGASASIQNLVRCVQGAGVRVLDLVLQPVAAGEAVLTNAEKELGVVLLDIGGGTTDIAVFIDGSVWHTVVLAVGGNHLTHDLAVGLRTPFTVAESLKIEYGQTKPENVGEDELIDAAAFGDNSHRPVSRQRLVEIIKARTEEMLELILRELKRSGYDGLLPAGAVLCGGTADLAGIKEFSREVLDLPVRIGAPRDLEGLVDAANNPAYACSVGLLRWGLRNAADDGRDPSRLRRGPVAKLRQWFETLVPG
jgi:cell division protein FtsA